MPKYKYSCFEELERCECEESYNIVCKPANDSTVAIIAPHGGRIEPGTSKIARRIAGMGDYNLYLFEGLRDKSFPELHIKSTNFDEPQCFELIAKCDVIIRFTDAKARKRRL